MAAVVKMKVNLVVPESAEVSGDMGQKWADSLTVNAARINDRRKFKIPDDGTFISKVAVPSSQGFQGMVADNFVSRRGRNATEIKGAHAKNAQESFAKWNNNLDLAFATRDGIVAKGFVENVANKAGNWESAAGKKTLRMTGDKIRGRGVAPILAELLVGYQLAQTWLREGDAWLAGTPYKICLNGMEGALKAGLVQLITRVGLTIVQNNYDVDVMEDQNKHLENFLNAIADPTKCNTFAETTEATDTYALFVLDGNILYLKTQIVLGAV